MLRISLCILIAASTAWAQTSASQPDSFRKESAALQQAVDDAIGEVGGTSVLQLAKATYLEEFGIFVSIEVALEPPRGPFSNPATLRSASSTVLAERQRLVREKVKQLVAQKASSVQSLKPDQSLVIAVHLFNSNPVDAPNLPAQMVFIVKKQDPTRVVIREQ
jgi:hypothetical protein